MSLRTIHSCLGMLLAPTVLFLACTGILQVYNLHEAHGGYTPPPLIVKLSSVHKDQVFTLPHAKAPKAPAAKPPASQPTAATPSPPEQHKGPKPAVLLLKAFFTLAALSLIVSTLLGLWIGLNQPLRRRTNAVLLAIGVIVPVVLALMTA